MKPGFQWKSILTVMALGWLFMLTPSASASSVDDVVDMIVKHVVKYLEDQGKKELFIDQFKGPRTSGGRLLETKVREKLKASGVEIKADDLEASWTLEGKLSTDTSGRSAIVAVRIELFDNGRNSMAEFTKRFRSDPEVQQELAASLPEESSSIASNEDVVGVLDGADDVAKVAATTVDNQSRVEAATGVSAESTPTKLAETPAESARQAVKIRNIPTSLQKDAITNPSFFADGPTRVRASSTSGFGLEIRASNTEVGPFVPVPVEDKGGRAFVNLQQEQFFEILVFNNESFDVGLELRMDGINTMHFAEGATPEFREDGKWLIRAGTQGAAIKGWFINPARVDRFIIKAEPDGVAAELGRPHSIGTIQASFFMARSPGQGPSQFASLFDQTRNAVGRGAPTEFGGTMETRVFESGQSLASIAVIYRNPTPPDLPPADLAP